MKSWKTTLFGAVTSLGVYLSTLHDPEWIGALGKLMAVSGPVLHGLFSRDNDKSSEDVAAK